MSLHIECAIVPADALGRATAPIESGRLILFSETVSAPGTSTNAVPDNGNPIVLTLTARVDMWVSVAETPNASANPRRLMLAGVTRSFWAMPGDRVAWTVV